MQQQSLVVMASSMTRTVALLLMTCSLTAQAAHLKGFQAWNVKAHAADLRLTANLTAVPASHSFGNKDCPCIGIDNVEGETMALVNQGQKASYTQKASYPADLGARCEAWDLKDNPKCPGEPWCAQQWCYVDPCNCNLHGMHLGPKSVLPKPASYLPDAKYQGKELFFSYATCGGADFYTQKPTKELAWRGKAPAQLITETCAADVSEKKWGAEDCRCVGVGPQPGTLKVNIKGKKVAFPASTGSTCNAWEKDNHPDCQGSNAPDWCTKAWCYVDPCKCNLATPPKTSSYLPEGNYQGKQVYYSYATCGAEDTFSFGDALSCDYQKTSSACAKMDKCAWSGKVCLGKELVTVCNDGKAVVEVTKTKANETSSKDLTKEVAKAKEAAKEAAKAKEAWAEVKDVKKEVAKAKPVSSYGGEGCPCVGIDNIEGKTMALIKKGQDKESYPADLGARCEAWDLKDHPKCPGESWCAQQWCYVDPCNCNIPVLPKPASYLPDAQYQGKPVFFSYATCGGDDTYTGEENSKDGKTAKLIKETCAADVSEKKWGEEDCRCVGVGPQNGTTKVNIRGQKVAFPVSTGSTCKAWEKENHPDCEVSNAPDWCNKAWCYVDPCKCKLATPPKTSSYLPDANYQGKPVYYSYATCGAEDSYSAGDKKACVNHKTSSDCAKMDKCAWSGKECLGKELVTVCGKTDAAKVQKVQKDEAPAQSAAFGLKGSMAFLLPLLSFVHA